MSMAEKKHSSASLNSTAITNANWNFLCPLFLIQQGTTANNRIGDKIFVHAIHFMVSVAPNMVGLEASTANNGTVCRFIIWHDKEANGTSPAYSDYFLTNKYDSVRQVSRLPKASIVKDWTHSHTVTAISSSSAAKSAGPKTLQRISIYPKKRICYQNNSADFTALLKDSYGIAFCADAANCCYTDITYQIIFSDA